MDFDLSSKKIAFIGAGKMATALASGIVKAGVLPPSSIIGCARTQQSLSSFKKGVEGEKEKEGGVVVSVRNEDGVRFGGGENGVVDIICMCVKPQMMRDVLNEMGEILKQLDIKNPPLLISVAAGVTSENLKLFLEGEEEGGKVKYVRVMPNTPAFVGEGALAYSLGPGAHEEEGKIVEQLFGCVGMIKNVPEKAMDAVVGVSGSGPAYVYQFIEALSDAGVRQGLPRNLANDLAVQTVLGAATMVKETGLHPAVLKDQVTSPGGTTIAAIEALEKAGMRAAVFDAVGAATKRSQELGTH